MSRALAITHGPFGRATLYELDRPMTLHAHREGHLIFFLGGTEGVVEVSGRTFLSSTSAGVAVNPWERHQFAPVVDDRAGTFLVLYLDPKWFQSAGRGQRAMRFESPVVSITSDIERAVGHLADRLATDRTHHDIDAALYDLYDHCIARSCVEVDQQDISDDQERIDFRVRKSMRLLSERFAMDPDLDVVARESGLSRPHFYKLFKEQTGVTPLIFLNTLRMEQAVALVAAGRDSITTISERLGFSCQSVFTRFFCSHVGMPPSDYRRAARILNG
jgi:AraC-like DNA-binding protein